MLHIIPLNLQKRYIFFCRNVTCYSAQKSVFCRNVTYSPAQTRALKPPCMIG